MARQEIFSCIWVKIPLEWGNCPLLCLRSASLLHTSLPVVDGGMEKGSGRSILETCAGNVSHPSHAVSITLGFVELAGAWQLVWVGQGHLKGTVGSWEGGGQQ